MKLFSKKTSTNNATNADAPAPRFPGIDTAIDGSSIVVRVEINGSEAAGAYPITPSTQMGEGWAAAVGAGHENVFGRRLVFFEPEGEHAAAAVTTGMNLTGLRSTNFSSGQGIAYMHESLYAAVGKRQTYVLNMACRAMTKSTLNVHAGHDDYHAVDDTGFFQLFGKSVQEVGDLCLIAHRTAELSLNPGICAQDGFLTSHVIENAKIPELELIKEYLGDPSDEIECPTAAQRLVYGDTRRRVPRSFDVDYPAMIGVVQNQDAYAQSVAAQRPFYFDHVAPLCDQAMQEFATLTGRKYARVTGYRMDDAELVLVGQGSIVDIAEVTADYMREKYGLKVGVVNMTMFRPFPADLVSKILAGKKAVCVLERLDQPLSVEAPLLREIRVAMGQAVENGRAPSGGLAYPGVASITASAVPDFYSACFGMGSRDLQPSHLIGAVKHMVKGGRRQFYLGIDFVRKNAGSPKMEIWQQKLMDAYPHLRELALEPAESVNLTPQGHTSIRIHSIGGWGAITMGKNLGVTASDLFGMFIKANPKYGSEKAGQPTTFYATLAPEPIKVGGELLDVDVVLSQDPNAFQHCNPLAGMHPGGVLILQSTFPPEELWSRLPRVAQNTIREKRVQLFSLDGFRIALAESSNSDLRYRMQGAAFLGAFFHCSKLMKDHGQTEDRLFDGLLKQLTKKFGRLGQHVVDDNMRVIRRGYDEVVAVDYASFSDEGTEAGTSPSIPASMAAHTSQPGIGDGGKFWEQVGHLYKTGQDPLADPFVAMSAMPAATSAMRDMTHVRFEIPKFIPENCTGCSQCWTQCPDTAIPGMVHTVEELLGAAVKTATNGKALSKFKQVQKHLAKETHRLIGISNFKNIGDVVDQAYETVKDKLNLSPEKRRDVDQEYAKVAAKLANFPIAKTGPFFDAPERKEKGSGGLLSITVNPESCKGCMECVEVCPDGALITLPQTDELVDDLRRNWSTWRNLPETNPRFVNIANLDEGIGTLSSMMIQRSVYESMLGGDGACMGCGEKTNIHLVLSALSALLAPRVKKQLAELKGRVAALEEKAKTILAAGADLEAAASGKAITATLTEEQRASIAQLNKLGAALKDLIWRYEEGPSGRGRSNLGIANSTGCTSVWASTYPYNPYPFPWVNHLFQDSPSVAVGIFEGHMRTMSDGYIDVRRADLVLSGKYDAERDEAFFKAFNWEQFTDEEFRLCPPILALGGDGAMMDIGFQNLSRMLASGKPIKAVVLDTQVYSNTGGQACTSGFIGQVSDMATWGDAKHGKTEARKELSLIAMAHRGVFVLQSSQAQPAHLLGGVIRGFNSRRAGIFILHSPCGPEHVIDASISARQAKLTVDSRAFPLLVFDPDQGNSVSDHLDLDGNAGIKDDWGKFKLDYMGDDDKPASMTLPMTVADWASTEGRFKKNFGPIGEGEALLFADYMKLSVAERPGHAPFIYSLKPDGKLGQLGVSPEMVSLAEERLDFWNQLREMAGVRPSETVRDDIEAQLESQFETKLAALQAEYEGKLATLQANYPAEVARSIARGLLASGEGGKTLDEILEGAPLDLSGIDLSIAAASNGMAPASLTALPVVATAAPVEAPPAPISAPPKAAVAVEEEEEVLSMEAYIDTDSCTSCNECIQVNEGLFAYNQDGLAEVINPAGGPFRDLVTAAERCPVAIIHPGTPLNPKEKDLDKWIERAVPFN